jgi:hypothetical protein
MAAVRNSSFDFSLMATAWVVKFGMKTNHEDDYNYILNIICQQQT